jgi:hypothetical protein
MSTRKTSGSKIFSNMQTKTWNTNSFDNISSMDSQTTETNYPMNASVTGVSVIS